MVLDMEPTPSLREGFSFLPEVIYISWLLFLVVLLTPGFDKNSDPIENPQILRCLNFFLGVSYFSVGF